MKIDNISIGCIIENTDTNTRYRLIGLNDKDAVMCQMDITKLVFVVISAMQMLELIGNGVIKVQNDDDVIFNINKLSGKAREQFELKRNIMNEVNNLFGPYYTGLMSKKAKPELKDILLKYNYSKASFWRMALKYYQSGMKDYSLVDGKVFGANKGKQYNITTKTGHDSKHHKESTLTIDDYTKMVINFVLMHNQQYDKNYHITKDMLNNKVQPVPAELWQYGVGKYGSPRPIKDRTQYLFNLMTPVNARISRRGISYDGLWYIAEHDAELANDMIKTGKKRVPFEVRIDKRDVGAVYYIRNNRLIKAQLNKRIAGNAEYAGMTMKEWDDIRNLKKQMDAEGKIYNEELSAFNYEINDRIVSSAKKEFYSDQHDMREARETEKQLVSSEGKIADKLDDDKQKQIMDLQNKEDKPLNNENVPQTFEEAFKMYFND